MPTCLPSNCTFNLAPMAASKMQAQKGLGEAGAGRGFSSVNRWRCAAIRATLAARVRAHTPGLAD